MESWDDENFEPPVVAPGAVPANKWEGEDEEEEVKESWEDVLEEKTDKTDSSPPEEVKPKPKRQTLEDKIAERERRKREEAEKRIREQQEEELSAEEKLRMQKESDLKIALETTFGGDRPRNCENNLGLDGFTLPETKEEFQEFTDALSKKLQPLSKNSEYPNFTENLLRNLCATMSSLDIKRIKNTLDNLYLEKQKIEKGEKPKRSKGKGKAKLKMDDGNPLSAYVDDYDEFNDFM